MTTTITSPTVRIHDMSRMTSTMSPVVSPEHVPDHNETVRAKTYKIMVRLSVVIPLETYHILLEYLVCFTDPTIHSSCSSFSEDQ